MHTNSLSAVRGLNDRQSRKQIVLKVYLESLSPLTDRQVMKALGFVDPNKVRPRIKDLLGDFELSELDYKVIDEETGEKVRVCRISTPEEKERARLLREKHQENFVARPTAPTKEYQQSLFKTYTHAERIS